jgi:hypothetical protein
LKKYEDDINLCSFIHEFSLSTGEYLTKAFISEFDAYFTDRDEYSRKKLIEKIQPYLHDQMLRGLNEFLKNSSNDFQAISDNVADIQNIYSPVIIKENEEIFYASGKFFRKVGDTLNVIDEKEVRTFPESFLKLADFINRPNVTVKNEEVNIYTSDKKVKILKEGANTIIVLNDKQVSFDAFTRFFMNEGIFRTTDNDILANAVNVFENFDNIYEIDYGKRIASKINEHQWIDVFRLGKNVVVSKVDSFNKTNEFFANLNATQTRNLVFEHIGYDMSKSFRDLLPEEQSRLDAYNKDIVELDEAMTYLTEKREAVVNEANGNPYLRENKKVAELIEAIDSELVTLKEKKLTIKNIVSQFETVKIGFKPEEYVTEATEVDKYWKDSKNSKKVLYFAQADDFDPKGKGTFIVGSQSLSEYKDNMYWNVEETGLSKDAAILRAQTLAKENTNGEYFETEDIYEHVEPIVAETSHPQKFEKGASVEAEIGNSTCKCTVEDYKTKEEIYILKDKDGKTHEVSFDKVGSVKESEDTDELLIGEGIKVKNVGEAKSLCKSNGIKVTSSKYTNGNAGEISTDDDNNALSVLRSYGMSNESAEPKSDDPDGVNKLENGDDNAKADRDKKHPSNENELQPGDKIQMKNEKFGIVNSINGATGETIVNMEDGKTVAVPKQFLSELKIITKKSEETNPEVKISDGAQTVQIEESKETEYAKELSNITAEPKSMSKKDFKEYIDDYTKNPDDYKIDLSSAYGKALLWAKDNIDKAFLLITKNESVIEESKESDWVEGESHDGKKIKVFALDYTSKSDDDEIKIKDEHGKESKMKKKDIKSVV